MTLSTNKRPGIGITPRKRVPRVLMTQTGTKKWRGCIYLSSHDMTGQVILFLKGITSDFSGMLYKNPIFVFCSANKAEVESGISEKLHSIIKNA